MVSTVLGPICICGPSRISVIIEYASVEENRSASGSPGGPVRLEPSVSMEQVQKLTRTWSAIFPFCARINSPRTVPRTHRHRLETSAVRLGFRKGFRSEGAIGEAERRFLLNQARE